MNWEAIHTLTDIGAIVLSVFAFFFSWASRKSTDVSDLKAKVSAIEANGEHALAAGDVQKLSDEIHELRGQLQITIRTVERMNQFLMERGGA